MYDPSGLWIFSKKITRSTIVIMKLFGHSRLSFHFAFVRWNLYGEGDCAQKTRASDGVCRMNHAVMIGDICFVLQGVPHVNNASVMSV